MNNNLIDLDNQVGVKTILFPDNQPHVQLLIDVKRGETLDVKCSIIDSIKLVQLSMVADAIDSIGCKKGTLFIPYLMGARYDRNMVKGDSFDLRVIASLINLAGFQSVKILDPHSDVSAALIKNSIAVSSTPLLHEYEKENAVLIVPDAGAAKKVGKYLESAPNLKDVVYCIKERNLENGNLQLKVLSPELCKNRNCVIVDDICDGGATFLAIANQLPLTKSLTLIVTHGIFSKGFSAFKGVFDNIITTNSLCRSYDWSSVQSVSALQILKEYE